MRPLFHSAFSTIFADSMRYVFLILFACLAAMTNAAAQPDSLMHVSFAKRYKFVRELEWTFSHKFENIADRKATLDSLQDVIEKVKKTGDDAFAYHLSCIYIREIGHTNNPKRLKEINTLIAKAEKEGFIHEATYGKARLANYYWRDEERVKALEVGLNAYNTYKEFTVEEFPERVGAQNALATWYRYFNDLNRSKELLLELHAATNGEVNEAMLDPIMNLAITYRELKQYDSALIYFTQVYNHSSKIGLLAKEGLAAGNIGSLYFFEGDYDKAILWFKRELQVWKVRNNNRSLPSVSVYTVVADAYHKKGDVATAMRYIDSADMRIRKVRKDFVVLRRFYGVKARLLAETGNYASALQYKDSVMMMMDSLFTYRDKQQLLVAEKRVAAARHEKEIQYLDALRKNSIWLRNFAIVTILLLAVIISLLINRSRLRHKQKELKAINDRKSAENKLLSFTRKMQEQNSRIDELQDELKNISDEQDVAAKHETITRLQQSTILTDEQWDEFRHMFEEVHSGFITRLKEKFPGLTPAELRYLTLLKLDLTNKEMANILGVNVNTIHNYKSRLRRKYSLADDVLPEDIVRDI